MGRNQEAERGRGADVAEHHTSSRVHPAEWDGGEGPVLGVGLGVRSGLAQRPQ